MNEEKKNINTQNNDNLEMPTLAPRVVKPIPVDNIQQSQPTNNGTQVENTQQSQPTSNEVPVQSTNPSTPVQSTSVDQSTSTTAPAETPAPENNVGTVVVGKPMSNVVKPIPVGEIGNFAPQATIGGGETPSTKKKSSPIAVVVLIVAVIFLIGYVLVTYVFKGKIGGDSGLNGLVSDTSLIYANVKEGNKINFKINDELKLVVKVNKLEVQENIGTKAYVTVSEENGSDSIELPYVWLNDDGSLKLDYQHLGDVAIFDSNNSITDKEIVIINSEGKITKLSDFSKVTLNEEKGLLIDSYFVNDNKLEIQVTRIPNTGFVKYGDLVSDVDLSQYADNEELMSKYASYVSSDSVSICLDNSKNIPEGTVVNALFTFSVKDGKLDLNNPEITNKETFSEFYNANHDVVCQ